MCVPELLNIHVVTPTSVYQLTGKCLRGNTGKCIFAFIEIPLISELSNTRKIICETVSFIICGVWSVGSNSVENLTVIVRVREYTDPVRVMPQPLHFDPSVSTGVSQ